MEVSLKAYATEKFLTVRSGCILISVRPRGNIVKAFAEKRFLVLVKREILRDGEKFFRRIRLKAHFHSEQESQVIRTLRKTLTVRTILTLIQLSLRPLDGHRLPESLPP